MKKRSDFIFSEEEKNHPDYSPDYQNYFEKQLYYNALLNELAPGSRKFIRPWEVLSEGNESQRELVNRYYSYKSPWALLNKKYPEKIPTKKIMKDLDLDSLYENSEDIIKHLEIIEEKNKGK